MTDTFVGVAPLWQGIVDGILIGVNLSAGRNRGLNQ